jgi:penicillin-insensitive murein endopeptidase
MRRTALFSLFALVAAVRADEPKFPWSLLRGPAAGDPESIGGYSAGCVRGAEALPRVGDGFRVMRPERGRTFGHPNLIALIRDLGSRMKKAGLGVLRLGDLSQPRGGPAPTGHASHQTGLDVDIWYLFASGAEAKEPRPVVDLDARTLTSAWVPEIARVLALVANDARVDRVFVNPLVKRALCEAGGKDKAWLHKIRPWWGHHEHFHVRLACPEGSPACEAQSALPAGDGCDELAWWLNPAREKERAVDHQAYRSKIGSSPKLPERCQEVLTASDR